MDLISIKAEEELSPLSKVRFPTKLWIIINSPNEIIIWGQNGTTILIDFLLLDGYLGTEVSIFKTKNLSSFRRQLNLYGFRKIATNKDDQEFEHSLFKRDAPHLLNEIKRKSAKQIFSQVDKMFFKQNKRDCFKEVAKISKLESSRLFLRTILEFQMFERQLAKFVENGIEIPNNCSFSEKIAPEPKPGQIAGFYGDVHIEKLKTFFGECLPTYEVVENVPESEPQRIFKVTKESNSRGILKERKKEQLAATLKDSHFQYPVISDVTEQNSPEYIVNYINADDIRIEKPADGIYTIPPEMNFMIQAQDEQSNSQDEQIIIDDNEHLNNFNLKRMDNPSNEGSTLFYIDEMPPLIYETVHEMEGLENDTNKALSSLEDEINKTSNEMDIETDLFSEIRETFDILYN